MPSFHNLISALVSHVCLQLSYRGIFLESHRPQFLCERLLDDADQQEQDAAKSKAMQLTAAGNLKAGLTSFDDNAPDSSDGEPQEEASERPVLNKNGSARFSFRSSGEFTSVSSTSESSKRRSSIFSSIKKHSSSEHDDLNTSMRKRIIGSVRRGSSTIREDQELNTSKHRSSASLLGESEPLNLQPCS